MRVGVAAAAAALVVALVPAAAGAVPGQPPPGKILLGVVGPSPEDFDALTGRHHPLHLLFGEWRRSVAEIVTAEHAAGRLPMLALPMSRSSREVANGVEDARWIELAQALNGTGKSVWMRVFPEMTGYWSPWCAFDASGRPRGPNYSTRSFVAAFRRVAIILRGGPAEQINTRLARAGLPPLRRPSDVSSSGRVAIIWNPQGHGVPFIPANGPAAYWPGGEYVDIVADDMFSDSGEPSWRGMDTLYGYGKPFLVGDWGLEAEDDIAFAARMFEWVAAHPRTIGLVYFNKGWSQGSTIYELRSKPRSLALYRQAIKSARFVAASP